MQYECGSIGNSLSFGWMLLVWMCALMASFNGSSIGMVLGLPFLAVFGVIVFLSVSMWSGVSCTTSIGLKPFIDIRSLSARSGLEEAISRFSFSSVGTLNCLLSLWYFGISHSILQYLVYWWYAMHRFRFRELPVCDWLITASTCWGLLRSASRARCLSICPMFWIEPLALPLVLILFIMLAIVVSVHSSSLGVHGSPAPAATAAHTLGTRLWLRFSSCFPRQDV